MTVDIWRWFWDEARNYLRPILREEPRCRSQYMPIVLLKVFSAHFIPESNRPCPLIFHSL